MAMQIYKLRSFADPQVKSMKIKLLPNSRVDAECEDGLYFQPEIFSLPAIKEVTCMKRISYTG
jgi:hypothetical protein